MPWWGWSSGSGQRREDEDEWRSGSGQHRQEDWSCGQGRDRDWGSGNWQYSQEDWSSGQGRDRDWGSGNWQHSQEDWSSWHGCQNDWTSEHGQHSQARWSSGQTRQDEWRSDGGSWDQENVSGSWPAAWQDDRRREWDQSGYDRDSTAWDDERGTRWSDHQAAEMARRNQSNGEQRRDTRSPLSSSSTRWTRRSQRDRSPDPSPSPAPAARRSGRSRSPARPTSPMRTETPAGGEGRSAEGAGPSAVGAGGSATGAAPSEQGPYKKGWVWNTRNDFHGWKHVEGPRDERRSAAAKAIRKAKREQRASSRDPRVQQWSQGWVGWDVSWDDACSDHADMETAWRAWSDLEKVDEKPEDEEEAKSAVLVPAPLNQQVPARTTTAASPPRAPCKKEAGRTAIAPAMARDLGAGVVL